MKWILTTACVAAISVASVSGADAKHQEKKKDTFRKNPDGKEHRQNLESADADTE